MIKKMLLLLGLLLAISILVFTIGYFIEKYEYKRDKLVWRVTKGMTKQDVEKIIGAPANMDNQCVWVIEKYKLLKFSSKIKTWKNIAYSNPDYYGMILFLNDKVIRVFCKDTVPFHDLFRCLQADFDLREKSISKERVNELVEKILETGQFDPAELEQYPNKD